MVSVLTVASVAGAGLCALLVHSHLDRPTLSFVVLLALLYATQVARRLVAHVLFARSLQRLAWDGSLAGLPVRHVQGLAPFVAGIMRPHVYCDPRFSESFTISQRRAVALHEQHHVRRRDPLRLQFSSALRPLGRFSPGVRALLDAHDVRYEIAADRHALRNGATGADLAGALLALLEDRSVQFSPGFVSATEARLQALRGDRSVLPSRSRGAWIMLGSTAAVFLLCVVVF